jgi:hypothetical protein
LTLSWKARIDRSSDPSLSGRGFGSPDRDMFTTGSPKHTSLPAGSQS